MSVTSIRKTSVRALTLVYILIILALAAHNPVSARAADARDRIDALLARYQEIGLFNGTALVADRGEVVIRKGYGLANMEWGIANAPAVVQTRLGI